MKELCEGCMHVIDPWVCQCGALDTDDHDGHTFNPMGCTCGYDRSHLHDRLTAEQMKELDPKIPSKFRPGLRLYLTDGIMPGSFLSAVLRNDLLGTLIHSESRTQLFDLVVTLANDYPSACWGSQEAVHAWVQRTDKERATILSIPRRTPKAPR